MTLQSFIPPPEDHGRKLVDEWSRNPKGKEEYHGRKSMVGGFIEKRPYLIWHTRDFKRLSKEAALEAVLNYGDFDDVKKIISILGIKQAAVIFRKQLRQRRINYPPKIRNFFELYFKKYA